MFVAIPAGWLSHDLMIAGFGTGSNGSSPTHETNTVAPKLPERGNEQCEACALPIHLFWAWFVDNPRRNLQ